jgi:hypothetical protein
MRREAGPADQTSRECAERVLGQEGFSWEPLYRGTNVILAHRFYTTPSRVKGVVRGISGR